jgi:hypothetical protein
MVDPILVRRVVVTEEQYLLFVFPDGVRDVYTDIWTLHIDEDKVRNRFRPRICIRRVQLKFSKWNPTDWAVKARYHFDPRIPEEFKRLREILFLRFNISNLPLDATDVLAIKEYLVRLPMHVRMSYREIDRWQYDEKHGCSKAELTYVHQVKDKTGGIA